MNGTCEQKHFHPGMKFILGTCKDTPKVGLSPSKKMFYLLQ